jgi:hypothetical protein
LQELCTSLSAECSTGFQVNAYLTPRNAQGLGIHYDTHDVFVLQVEGSKHWCLFESPLRLPLPNQPYRKGAATSTTQTQEFDLNAGDLLYLPRGVIHEAISREETSLHLTVGVHPITWAEVILVAVELAVEQNYAFRGGLPLGFARDEPRETELEAQLRELMKSLVANVSYRTVIGNAITRARLARKPIMRGHLHDLDMEKHITMSTPVRRRDGLQWWLSVRDKEVCLQFHGKEVWMPSYVGEDLRFIEAAKGPFTGAMLPGQLSEEGRLTLVRRLLREGFLTVIGIPPIVVAT